MYSKFFFIYLIVALFSTIPISGIYEALVATILNIAVFVVLPVLMYTKFVKKVNVIMIILLALDIMGGFWFIFESFLPALLYIAYRVLLIFLCVENVKWFNENYEYLSE